MDQNQKELLVTNVQKYNKDIGEKNREIIKQTFIVSVSVLGLAVSLLLDDSSIKEILVTANGSLIVLNALFDIAAIAQKIGLQSKVKEIEKHLKINTIQEDSSKGMAR